MPKESKKDKGRRAPTKVPWCGQRTSARAHHAGEGLGLYGSEVLGGCAADSSEKYPARNRHKSDLAGCFPLGRSCVEELFRCRLIRNQMNVALIR